MKVFNTISRWMGYFSAVFIIVLMLLVTADVCARYFVNSPIKGASELARHMMALIVFPALAWTAIEWKHIKVDFVMDKFPRRAQAITNVFILLLSLGVYVIITWRSFIISSGVTSYITAVNIPHSPYYWVMSVGWVVFCLSIVALIIKNISEAVKK